MRSQNSRGIGPSTFFFLRPWSAPGAPFVQHLSVPSFFEDHVLGRALPKWKGTAWVDVGPRRQPLPDSLVGPFSFFLVSDRVKTLFSELQPKNLEFQKVEVRADRVRVGDMWFVQPVGLVDAIDWDRSDITADEEDPSFYQSVRTVTLDPERTEHRRIFLLRGFESELTVNAEVRARLLSLAPRSFEFERLEDFRYPLTAQKEAVVKKVVVKKAVVKKAVVKKAVVKKAVVKKAVKKLGPLPVEPRWKRRFSASRFVERPQPSVTVDAFSSLIPLKRRTPSEVANEVSKVIDLVSAGKRSKRNLELPLSAAWTYAVVEGLGWERVELKTRDGREFGPLLCDPERRWIIEPRHFMRRLLGLDKGWCGDNTALLLFNMMEAKNLPRARAGAYLPIG